jgi:hypothetical protein
MQAHALRPYLLVLAAAAAALAPVLVASPARGGSPDPPPKEHWPLSQDKLLSEIQTHFHGTRKWFGMVSDLRHDRAPDGTITPRLETLSSTFVLRRDAAGQSLRARLPARASAAHVVEYDGLDGFSVRTEEIGVQPVPAEVHQGVVVYRGAVAGGDLLYKLTPTHVDEYLYLRDPPAHLRREFEFDTGSAVWTLREADTMIEALGKDGIARLRLSAPLARAVDGQRRRGTAHVVGRKIVLDINLAGLVPPILVDPDWSTTGSMTVAHWGDAAWLRPDGHVMAVGGCALTSCPTSVINTACGQVLANTDEWDPSSGTWTSGPAMLTARTTFAGVPLPSGDLLVAGGCTATNCTQMNDAGNCLATPCTQTTASTERFSFATKSWVDTGTLSSARWASMGAPLGSDALVAGGCDVGACTVSTERWSAATNTWSEKAPLGAPRGFGTATVLADGRVLVVGGCADPQCATVLSDATVYDPAANTWSAAGSMSSPRLGHTATLLRDGTVLVAGGCTDVACMTVLATTDIWTASSAGGHFMMAPAMAGARHHHTATLLANGEVLAAGGANSPESPVPASLTTSEVYLPLARQWIGACAMHLARAFHIGAELSDGRVMVAGGCNPQTCIPFAEVFSPASLPADSDAGVDAGVCMEDSGPGAGPVDAGPAPLPVSPHPPLYRTGVTSNECARDTTQDQPCPQAGWELQDSDFQPNAQALVQTASDEVTDNTTGLVWQLGGDSNTYTQTAAVQHCANFQSAEAATGWRLPSVVELMSLVDRGVDIPSIDPSFSGTQSTNYWTATPTASSNGLAWTVKFDYGEVIPLLTNSALPVRCVRGTSKLLNVGGMGLRTAGPLTATPETVQDTTTGLEWQRADDGTKRTWKDSLDYCSRLSVGGLSGWHLPNVSELLGIVQFDAITNGVAIDPAFQNAKGDIYWTSTQNEGAPTLSWSITFNLGVVDGVTVTGLGYARCVRHIEPSPGSNPDSGPTADSGSSADSGPSPGAGAVDGGPASLPFSPHPPLYRTGVASNECATDTTQDLRCPVAGWELQDGDFQPNAQALVQTASDEITDNMTGLVWQLGDDGNAYTQAAAFQHCAGFKSAEAATGWRLPSVLELMTLINRGIYNPSIDPSFSGARSTNYWTGTPTASSTMLAWTVKFDYGEVVPLLKDTKQPARCVRGKSDLLNVGSVGLRAAGPLTTWATRVDGGAALSETVQDTTTGLEWQRADDGTKRTWKDSLDYCSRLSVGGLSGWHLPNVSELLGIIQFDAITNGVAIDPAFQNAKAALYWTSTPNEGAPGLSWSVTFDLGVADSVTVTGLGYARCVRHMQPSSGPSPDSGLGPDTGPSADSGPSPDSRRSPDSGPCDADTESSPDSGPCAPPEPSPSSGGCGCEVPGASGRGAVALWVLALAGAAVPILRRRAQPRSSQHRRDMRVST